MKKKVVIYVRVSTDLQDVKSQLNELNQYCLTNDFDIIKTYQETISGMKVNSERDLLNECLDFVKNKNNGIDTLLVWELSRIGRRLKDVINIMDDLIVNKINLYVHKDSLNTLNPDKTINNMTKIYISIMSTFAEIEHSSIIERSKRGKRDKVINLGKFGGGGIAPYGYDISDGYLVINTDQSLIVKKIFEMFIGGNGIYIILNWLNSNNIPTKTEIRKGIKNQWKDKVVYGILNNSIYCGEMVYKGEVVNKPELKIIEKEQFELVKKMIKNRINKKIFKKFDLLIDKSLIKCGVCGRTYHSHKRLSKSDNVYKCLSKRYKEQCDNYGIGIDKLNDVIYYHLRRTNELKKRFYDNNVNDNEIKIENYKNKINELKVNLNDCSDKEQRLVDLYINQKINRQNYETKYNDIQDIKKRYINEINVIEASINNLVSIDIKKQSLNDYFVNLKINPLSLKDTINEIVREIVIYPLTTNYLSKISNDYNYYIELFLFVDDKPIRFVCSQRSEKIISNIPMNVYDKQEKKLKTIKGLKINDIIYHINYDGLVNN